MIENSIRSRFVFLYCFFFFSFDRIFSTPPCDRERNRKIVQISAKMNSTFHPKQIERRSVVDCLARMILTIDQFDSFHYRKTVSRRAQPCFLA